MNIELHHFQLAFGVRRDKCHWLFKKELVNTCFQISGCFGNVTLPTLPVFKSRILGYQVVHFSSTISLSNLKMVMDVLVLAITRLFSNIVDSVKDRNYEPKRDKSWDNNLFLNIIQRKKNEAIISIK